MNTYSMFSISHRLSAHFEDNSVYFEVLCVCSSCPLLVPSSSSELFCSPGLACLYGVWAAYSCKVVSSPTFSTNSRPWLLPCVPASAFSALIVFVFHLVVFCLSFSMAFTWTSSVVGLALLLHLHCGYFVCSVTLFVVSNLVLLAIYFVCGCLRCRTWYAVFDVAVSKCAELTRFCLCFEVANAVEAFS